MKIRKALKKGTFLTWNNKRLWLLLFTVQFVFALMVLLPLRSRLLDWLGNSLLGEEILRGNGALVLVEFLIHHAQTVSTIKAVLMIAGVIYLVITLFLNGGILSRFQSSGQRSPFTFWSDCAALFGRFLRLFLLSLPFLFLALFLFLVYQPLLSLLADRSEPAIVLLNALSLLLFIGSVFLIQMVFDYARIITIHDRSRSMARTVLNAWRFVFRHPLITLGVYGMMVLLGALFFLIYQAAATLFASIPLLAGWILFFWQQSYVFMRSGLRMMCLASETALYTAEAPAAPDAV
jgi:hypothetical protein